MMNWNKTATAALGLVCTLGLSSPASAADWILKDTSDQFRESRMDATLHFSPGVTSSFGVSGWYLLPIVPRGFIRSLNDQFNIEFGGSFERYNHEVDFLGTVLAEQNWLSFTPMGGVRWDFHLTPTWTVFTKAKAGFSIGFNEDLDGRTNNNVTRFVVDTGVGAYMHFSDAMALRLEASTFGLLTVGISLAL